MKGTRQRLARLEEKARPYLKDEEKRRVEQALASLTDEELEGLENGEAWAVERWHLVYKPGEEEG